MATGRIPINGTAAIQETIVDAKGDLIVGTGADAVARLAVGTNGHTLVADSSTATGLAYAAPAAGGANWSLLNSGGTALTGAATVTVTGISGKDKILVIVDNASSASGQSAIGIQVNTNTGSIYYVYGFECNIGSSYSAGNFRNYSGVTTTISLGLMSTNTSSTVSGGVTLTGCNAAGVKQFSSVGGGTLSGATEGQYLRTMQGYIDTSSTISSVSVVSGTGNLDAGTVYVYTSA